MNILSLTAGAASMYCGSCLRDNALAAELIARGHDVTLLPVYTPTLTDEPNVSKGRVFFGGISVYLQQHVPFFRWTPAFLDKLWDSGSIINMFAKRSIQVDARMLGEMTVSMLKGEHGHQRKELDKMIAWLRTQPAPDVINLPFTLLIGLARPLREAFGVPIVCTLQGEDLFLDQLHEPYKNEVAAADSPEGEGRRSLHRGQRLLREIHGRVSVDSGRSHPHGAARHQPARLRDCGRRSSRQREPRERK